MLSLRLMRFAMYYRFAETKKVLQPNGNRLDFLYVAVYDKPKESATTPLLTIGVYPSANRNCLPHFEVDVRMYEGLLLVSDEIHRVMHFMTLSNWKGRVSNYDMLVGALL